MATFTGIRSYANAQFNLGVVYDEALDYVQAHMWFNLAASRFTEKADRDKAVSARDRLAEIMTPEQITEAQKLAREWKPK